MTDLPPFSEWAEWEGEKEAEKPEEVIRLGSEETWEDFLANMAAAAKGMLEKLGEHSPRTLEHSGRVALYSILLGRCLGLEGADRFILESGALLHDMGMLNVPAEILENPQVYEEMQQGELETFSEAQCEMLRSHTSAGYSAILDRLPFPELAELAMYHHERLDGSGHHQLEESRIPRLAKVVAVADSYDMMTEMYEKKRSPREALDELKALAGVKYDDLCVKALELVLEGLELI